MEIWQMRSCAAPGSLMECVLSHTHFQKKSYNTMVTEIYIHPSGSLPFGYVAHVNQDRENP